MRGLRHRLTWWGERTTSPVVLLHGWMDAGATWQFLVDNLPSDWTCVAPDWRGFGGSEWAPGGYWFPDYFADLDALLDLVCPDTPARLLAHSMGGNVASMYSGMRPQRVRWLANLEGIGLRRRSPDEAPAHYVEWLDQVREPPRQRRYTSLDVLAEFLVSRNPAMTLPRARFMARAWTRPDGDGFVLSFDPRHRLLNPMLFRRDEAEACWRKVAAPVLLLLGERSEIRTRVGEDAREEYFHSMFADIRIVTVAGVGHMMHLEDPESVAQHVAEFAVGR